MVCADYSGKCQSSGEVLCSVCGQGFCWDHILTLCFAHEEAILQERSVCRNCTEQLVDELEEGRRHLKHNVQLLEQDVAALQKQVDELEEGRRHLKHDVLLEEQDVATLQKQAEESEGYLDV